MSTAVNISSSEMIGAKFVLLVCNGTPGRMGGTETCFYYVSVNFDRTYCFFWQKFCCWSSSVLRIENLVKSYHCPWKWLFQNEVRGRRWDKACFVCSAGKHQRLGREFDARTVSFWSGCHYNASLLVPQLSWYTLAVITLNQKIQMQVRISCVLLCSACKPLFLSSFL